MRIDVPDEIMLRAQTNVVELKIALAVQLYADNRIDHADACRLAGVSRALFNREIVIRGISIHIYPAAPRIRRKAG